MSFFSSLRVGTKPDPLQRTRRPGAATLARRRRIRAGSAATLVAALLGGYMLMLPSNAAPLKPEDGRAINVVMRWAQHTAHVTYIDLVYQSQRGAALYEHRSLMTDADFRSARDAIRVTIKNDEWVLGRAKGMLGALDTLRDEWFHLYAGSPDSPILGPAKLTAEQMAAYAQSMNRHIKTTVPILDLARMFLEEGSVEGVRGDVAFAQAIKETGDFSSSDVLINNFAGLGHCSACPKGDAFATARDGVRAQIQLLRWLADPSVHSLADFASQPATLPTQFTHNGHSRATWASLGGLWAPNPQYGASVYGLFLRMYEWSLAPARRLHS